MTSVEIVNSSHLRSTDTPRYLSSSSADNIKHMMHFSDVHLRLAESLDITESENIPFAYGADATVTLLNSALGYAKALIPDPDFFLYTGDHVAHASQLEVGELSKEYVAGTLKANVEIMSRYYTTNFKVSTLMGNADITPDYTMEVTDPAIEVNPSIKLISGVWQNALSASSLDWFNRRGYLSYDLDEKLVILTLNTVPYSPRHSPDANMVDPFDQFAWLNETLLGLRYSGKVAYIVGHIPPIVDSYSGAQMWEPSYITAYKSIVSKYADIIKAQFFGHVHSIEFRVPTPAEQHAQEEAGGVDLVPLFMSAAISPIFYNNPAFMVWDFDATTYEVLDFIVYGTNISSDSQELNWHPIFKASTEYGVSLLQTSELNGFVERAAADPTLLDQYHFNSVAHSYLRPPCVDATCQSKLLCTLHWWTTSEEYQSCVSGQGPQS
ncbi:Peptidyl-tRNA hydrolase protein 2, mitochondrial [Phytophthora boehmeriae]|uniref:Peptidyl-tRNA hydrolase protein 2, mitochondrial n=1 Tax=Phytophthora boehmeriae TaxID=109152 RepID=A0A8T1VVN1_9STRA|nr:Peptidyl-tRNA hydrolase protein 2, mitochondrial [Phytophthora boehmeriae]